MISVLLGMVSYNVNVSSIRKSRNIINEIVIQRQNRDPTIKDISMILRKDFPCKPKSHLTN